MSKEVQKVQITTVRDALEKMKGQFEMVLPKHLTPDRLCRIAITAIQQTPKLLDCDRQSLFSAIMRSAQLGLEPDGVLGQAYLIPYGKQVQFIPGYKGLIDLARRSGDVSNIIAKEVCEHDDFEINWHEITPFRHKQPTRGERGEVIGCWALARFKDGGFHWDYMSVDEILKIRDGSSGWKSAVQYNKTATSPWTTNPIEMYKKTVIRRIAKFLPMSVQRAAMVEDLVDQNKKFTVDEMGEITLDNSDDPRNLQDVSGEGGAQKASKMDMFAPAQQKPNIDKQQKKSPESLAAEIITAIAEAEDQSDLNAIISAQNANINDLPDNLNQEIADCIGRKISEFEKKQTSLELN